MKNAQAEKVKPNLVNIPNGLWTVTSLKTGKRKTFRLHTWKETGMRQVSILTGCDNSPTWGDYTIVGHLKEDGTFQVSRKIDPKSDLIAQAIWFATALPTILSGEQIPGTEILASVKCACCNRTLTVPDSILTGLGPICAGRWK